MYIKTKPLLFLSILLVCIFLTGVLAYAEENLTETTEGDEILSQGTEGSEGELAPISDPPPEPITDPPSAPDIVWDDDSILGYATNFSAVIFGNYTGGSSSNHIIGPAFIGGNAEYLDTVSKTEGANLGGINGWDVPSFNPVIGLVLGGESLNTTDIEVHYGSAITTEATSERISDTHVYNTTRITAEKAYFTREIDEAKKHYQDLAKRFLENTKNIPLSTPTDSKLVFDATTEQYYRVKATDLSGTTHIDYEGLEGTEELTIVVTGYADTTIDEENITKVETTFKAEQNLHWNRDNEPEKVQKILWIFDNAVSKLYIHTDMAGSILAPDMDIKIGTDSNGSTNGTVIVNNVELSGGGSEMHWLPFDPEGTLPDTPDQPPPPPNPDKPDPDPLPKPDPKPDPDPVTSPSPSPETSPSPSPETSPSPSPEISPEVSPSPSPAVTPDVDTSPNPDPEPELDIDDVVPGGGTGPYTDLDGTPLTYEELFDIYDGDIPLDALEFLPEEDIPLGFMTFDPVDLGDLPQTGGVFELEEDNTKLIQIIGIASVISLLATYHLIKTIYHKKSK